MLRTSFLLLKRLSIIWCKHAERPKGFYEDLFRLTRAIVNCVGSGVSMVENSDWVPFFSSYDKKKHQILMAKKSIDAVCH